MMTIADQLIETLKAENIRARITSVEHVGELKAQIERDRENKILPDPVYRSCFSGIEYEPEKIVPGAKSIIIAAIPSPLVRNRFQWQGKTLTIMIPPVYSGNLARLENFKSLLTDVLTPHGFTFANAPIPKKLLAVRCGLGEYGRNNICYVSGLGSFAQLVTMYSDLPCPEDYWREPVMMSSCDNCTVCRENCPAGAIDRDRFPITSDHCLTFFNENTDPFADWVKLSWFDCLVGCLQCQNICPANAPYLNQVIDGERFSEEETALLLSTPSPENVPSEIKAKLERLDMFYMEIIPRNLAALLKT